MIIACLLSDRANLRPVDVSSVYLHLWGMIRALSGQQPTSTFKSIMARRKYLFVSALFLLMVMGFLATSLSSYIIARNSLSESVASQTLPLTSDNIYSEIQRDLIRPVLISSLMANDTFVRDWTITGEADNQRIISYLNEIQQQYGTISAFFVSEQTRQYYHPEGVLRTVSPDDPQDSWYFRVRDMREPYEVNVDTDTADSSRVNIFINYRVFDYNRNYIGATGVGLSVNAVTDLINTYQDRYERSIYFVDRQGNVTLTGTSGTEMPRRLQDKEGIREFSTQILSTPSTSLSFENENNQTSYINARLVPEFDWYLIVEQSGMQGESELDTALFSNLGISAAIMLLVLVIAHFTLQAYQQKLEVMATTDRLTGTGNRHYLESSFEDKIRSLGTNPRPLAMLIIDIDFFKRVNDTHGHHAGDLVLQSVANCIRSKTRNTDLLCRWGGEEFALLLDNCDLENALKRAEDIRAAVKSQSIAFGKTPIHLTLSAGVTIYHKGETLEGLISRADTALYQAKENGRDQVVSLI